MEKFGKGQSVKRVEDVRFLTGKGRYIGDVMPEGALHAYFLRSYAAHAVIASCDVEDAREMPGVSLVLTAPDLVGTGLEKGLSATLVKNRDGSKGANPRRPFLADGRVRFVGEIVAMIVADSLEAARDAAESIIVDYEDLPAKVDVLPGGETLHDDAPDNVAFDFGLGDEAAVAKALANSDRVVELELEDNRIMVASLEPRGAFAEWDGGKLHLAFGGQGVWDLKDRLIKRFGLAPDMVRVTNPDVGGGFGMKGMDYPEYSLLAQASKLLDRPVRWMSDRTEAMLSDNAGRDLTHRARMGFDKSGKITAYAIDTLCNLGAYNSQFAQPIQTELFAKVMTGTYDIQTAWLGVRGIYTNTAQVDAYRGAGRPEAIFVLERMMEVAARELGMDAWDLRRRNFIPPARFPYKSFAGAVYDVGEFAKVLETARQTSDLAGFSARRQASESAGLIRGIGLCYYIESILGDPEETTRIDFNEDGTLSIYVGTQSFGQGHETVFAQFLSDHTGVPADRISVIQGDSDLIPKGGGTGGSRSVTVQNTATLATVDVMVESYGAFFAELTGVDPESVSFDDVAFRAEGTNRAAGYLELAEEARAAGRADLLRFSRTIKLENRSFPNGAHVAEVEIDPETGETKVDRYTVVDDFGVLINPMLVEGQIHGGVAQGLGQAISERVVYDEDGQLLTASFMDYAMPRAEDVPMVKFQSEPTPSLYNPMGMKGCGEAGTVGALAAITNAVEDALWARGVRKVDMPFTPQRVWAMMDNAAKTAH